MIPTPMEAENIKNIYLANVRDVTAMGLSKGITPVFIWQPIIFNVPESQLNEQEIPVSGNTQNPELNLNNFQN